MIDALHFIERYKTDAELPGRQARGACSAAATPPSTRRTRRGRLGADEVHVFYRRTEKEMPAFRVRV